METKEYENNNKTILHSQRHEGNRVVNAVAVAAATAVVIAAHKDAWFMVFYEEKTEIDFQEAQFYALQGRVAVQPFEKFKCSGTRQWARINGRGLVQYLQYITL